MALIVDLYFGSLGPRAKCPHLAPLINEYQHYYYYCLFRDAKRKAAEAEEARKLAAEEAKRAKEEVERKLDESNKKMRKLAGKADKANARLVGAKIMKMELESKEAIESKRRELESVQAELGRIRAKSKKKMVHKSSLLSDEKAPDEEDLQVAVLDVGMDTVKVTIYNSFASWYFCIC